jgi:hypothetical protein
LLPVGGVRIQGKSGEWWILWKYYAFMYENGKMRLLKLV